MHGKPKAPLDCLFQGCYNPAFEAKIRKCKDKCWKFNQLSPNDSEAQQALLTTLIGKMGENAVFTPPFWCDYGYNITVGDWFYANHNLVIQDGASVTFGNHVFIDRIAVLRPPSIRPTPNSANRVWKLPSPLPSAIMFGLVQVLPCLQV